MSIFNISAIAEQSGYFETMNSGYATDISKLPPVGTIYPDKTWQFDGKWFWDIKAWIDIVGFTNTVLINGTWYSKESPINSAIIRYDAVHYTGRKPDITLSVYPENNNIVAKIKAVQHYSRDGYQYTDISYFYDRIIAPIQYDIPKNPNITIQDYGLKKVLQVTLDPLITSYSIHSKNGSVIRYYAGKIEYRSGIPYLNFTEPYIIKENEGKGIQWLGNEILIEEIDKNETNIITESNFYTPFGEVNLTPEIRTIKMPLTKIVPFMYFFMLFTGVCVYAMIVMIKKAII